jgi:glycosyltransferase involved in cell wall biosynthesis
MTSDRPLTSIVIPTLNAGPDLALLLADLKDQHAPGPTEIIVADSQSTDGSRAVAQEAGARVLTIPRAQFNHGRTRNQAVAAAQGEFVALTVQDARPTDPFWLARLLEPLLQDPSVAGSYGLQVAREDSGLLARTRSALWCRAHRSAALQMLEDPERFGEMSPERRLDLIRFDNVTSCVRKSAWQGTPFPEIDYAEDMAWAREMVLQGYKLAHAPTAQVWHSHERGQYYELRRAYVDGAVRVKLVDWPASPMTGREMFAAVRRLAFFLTTRRFDSFTDPEEIQEFLRAERYHYRDEHPTEPIRIYQATLGFADAMAQTALQIGPAEGFSEGAWIELFRFALVAVTGQALGAASTRNQTSAGQRLAWGLLDRLLARGV